MGGVHQGDLSTRPAVQLRREARAGIEPANMVLQTAALPLGYRAAVTA